MITEKYSTPTERPSYVQQLRRTEDSETRRRNSKRIQQRFEKSMAVPGAERVLSNFSGTNAMFGFRTRQHAALRIEKSTGTWRDLEPFTFLNASDIKYDHDGLDLNKFQQVEKK